MITTIGILLAAGGVWFGHAAWRAHHQLVTLDVREAPLADVLRKIESQTWTKVRAEKSLDARITLRVKDAPLRSVLDKIAEQAGVRWSTIYAVYDSTHALQALDSVLRGDGKLEEVGWTRMAPKIPIPGQLPGKLGPLSSRFDSRTDGPMPTGEQRRMMFRTKPIGSWPPEELVAEASLSGQISSVDTTGDLVATADCAARAARAVKGKWTTYLAFRKLSSGIVPGREKTLRGAEVLGPYSGPRYSPNESFANLTPEQRVRQARQRMAEH